MIHSALTRSQVALTRCADTLAQHPKHLTAAVIATLLGAGGGAWAVASLGPDAAELPVQTVLQTVMPLNVSAATESGTPDLKLYRSDQTRSTDTAASLLTRLGINDPQAAQFLRQDPLVRQHLLARSGRHVSAETREQHQLARLSMRWSADDGPNFNRLVVEHNGSNGFTSRLESAPLVASAHLASGTITSSLFAATEEAGLPDVVATQLAELFSADIDFRRSLRKNDRFNVVYEVLEGDGERLRTGRILSAEFVNANKVYQAMWFQPPGTDTAGKPYPGGYYALDGQSQRRAFLSSPVEFSRVSSGFAMRFHPVLKTMRPHLGTDFAASTGTPARSVADGVVSFAGWQNGYGNVVFIKHRGNTDTVYAHLSKILVKRGQGVTQAQTIGLVGSTGWATGPHLHFEVRVNGVHQDPMKMARNSEAVVVPKHLMPQFKQAADLAKGALQAAATVQSTRFE